MNMQTHPAIKAFVQNTLGCACPEDVFETIEYRQEPGDPCEAKIWDKRINVGNRLLIYIVNIDEEPSLADNIQSVLAAGVSERNSKGFNRFRLVLVSPDCDATRHSAEKIFNESAHHDEKTHLHIVDENEVSGF